MNILKTQTIFEHETNTKRWVKNGIPHREDGPAVIINNDKEIWMLNGLIHRVGAPAVFYKSCVLSEEWKQKGVLHRFDGAALTDSSGKQFYYFLGYQITEEVFKDFEMNTLSHLSDEEKVLFMNQPDIYLLSILQTIYPEIF